MQNSKPNPSHPTTKAGGTAESGMARFGLALANWSERWFPDPLVFALAGVVIVFLFGLLIHQPAGKLAIAGGKSFWALVPFTMQMVMIIIGGYVVASTPVVYAPHPVAGEDPQKRPHGGGHDRPVLHADLAGFLGPQSHLQRPAGARDGPARQGHGLSCGGRCSLPGTGRNVGAGAVVFGGHDDGHQGRDSALLLAISGLIPLGQTIFLWQSMLTALILIVVSVLIAYLSAPSAENAKTAEDFGIEYESADRALEPRTKPGEWLEYSPLLTLFVVAVPGLVSG